MRLSIVLDTNHPQRDGKCALKIRISQKGKFADIPLHFSGIIAKYGC